LIKNTSVISPTTLPTVKDALDNLSGRSPTTIPVPIAEGGTGQITAALALTALGGAPLASPTFTGVPAAPTAVAATNTTQLATTAFVTTADNLKANLASPTFTGVPAAPTAAADTNTTQLATTAFATTADNLRIAAALLTARGQIIRRGASAPEALAAQTVNTFLGGDGTDVATRTAAQVLTSLGFERSTWTPTITASSGTFTLVSATGNYFKLERLVISFIKIIVTTVGTASGHLRFTLPYTTTAQAWPVYGVNASSGVGLTGYVTNPSTTQGFVVRYDGTTPIAANAYRIAAIYESTT